ncbi:MAG: hypothetical protein QXU98_11650 [Candidatus Parvarchaeota archaeon]
MSEEITKTVSLVSPRLTAKKAEALSYVYKTYGEILKEAVYIMQYKGITSWVKAYLQDINLYCLNCGTAYELNDKEKYKLVLHHNP